MCSIEEAAHHGGERKLMRTFRSSRSRTLMLPPSFSCQVLCWTIVVLWKKVQLGRSAAKDCMLIGTRCEVRESDWLDPVWSEQGVSAADRSCSPPSPCSRILNNLYSSFALLYSFLCPTYFVNSFSRPAIPP